MTTRCLVGSCLLSLWATAEASAQVVVLSPPVPIIVPEVVPFVVGPPPAFVGAPGTAPRSEAGRSNYPATSEAETQRRLGPRVIHERHYLSPTVNVSNYIAAKSSQQYGPETMLVIRDFFINDEPPKSTTPPPVGAAEDRSTRATPPRNSTDADMERMLGTQTDRKESSTGVKAPDPSAADNGQRKTGEPGRINYPPNEDFIGPPRPPAQPLVVENATNVSVISRNGGTPMAEMELNFVDLAGKHSDVKGRTDGKGEFQARLAPSRWQVFLVVGENDRKSLGVILVKPSPGEPFKLQF